MAKALVPIADGTEELEAVTIIDTLVRGGIDVTVASVMAQKQVTCSRGVKIVADMRIDECKDQQFDLIALPGGLPGAEHLRDCDPLIAMLKKQKQAGRLYAAICASPACALQTHGLIAGKKATCYPAMLGELKDARPSNEKVVVDGNCITSQGPATALAFALKLVELLAGPEKARQTADAMLV